MAASGPPEVELVPPVCPGNDVTLPGTKGTMLVPLSENCILSSGVPGAEISPVGDDSVDTTSGNVRRCGVPIGAPGDHAQPESVAVAHACGHGPGLRRGHLLDRREREHLFRTFGHFLGVAFP